MTLKGMGNMSYNHQLRWRVALLVAVLASGASTALAGGPHWGTFKDDGCQAANARQFSAILWDIPSGQSWEDTCWQTPGLEGRPPNRCVNTGFNMWGEWDVVDNSCRP